MYRIKEIAEVILSYQSMTHKKLQKLLYYIYAWYFVIFEEKISDIFFEAWVHGPVSPELYQKYKCYGWNNINRYLGDLNMADEKLMFISKILERYGEYDADELEDMTHKELPWKNARKGLSKYAYSENVISDEDIKRYYSESEREFFNQLTEIFKKNF